MGENRSVSQSGESAPVSYWSPDLGPSTIPAVLRRAIERFADRPWMAFRGEEWTFAELGTRVQELIGGLERQGIARGDRVGLFLGNCFDWLALEYAVVSMGAALVPLNTALKARELDYIIHKSEMTTLIWGGTIVGHDTRPLLESLVPEVDSGAAGAWTSSRFPSLQRLIGVGNASWPRGVIQLDDVLANDAEVPPTWGKTRLEEVPPESTALIIFTSGTTGAPKGALIRHSSIVDHLELWCRRIRLCPDDRSILASPLFWTFGCTMNAVVPLLAGSMIVLDDQFAPEKFVADLVGYRCTHLQGVPTHYELALNHPSAKHADLSAVRLIQIGGSMSVEPLIRQVHDVMPEAEMISAYGLTEGVICSTWTERSDPLEDIIGTVGHAAPDNDLELRDVGTGSPVATGEVGEIWLRGPNITRGYLDDPNATSAALIDGWFNTGDLATADDRGYLTIVGRSVDAFKRGGANVYPAEIEAVLSDHPSVLQSAVVGVPDSLQGEVGAAFIVAGPDHPTAEELLGYCREQLASYKVPAYLHFVEELPMTPTGKVQKYLLKEAWSDETTHTS